MPLESVLPQRLRIAMLVGSFSTQGGLELYTLKLVEGLLNQGHQITVLCEKSTGELSHENLTVVNFPPPSPKITKYQKIKHNLHSVDQLLDTLGPFDITHSQHFPTRKASVVTFHNQTTTQLNRVGFKWEQLLNRLKCLIIPAYKLRTVTDGILCQNAACLIFPANIMQKDFAQTYKFKAPYVIAHPGATMSENTQTVQFNQSDIFSFLFVGRGYRKKGLDVLLGACRILCKQNRKFKLLIAGLRAKAIDRIRLKILGLENTVQYLGFQKDMSVIYKQASVFVTPSKMEPFGMAAVQAMQFGLIPIVSKVSGVSEVLTHNKDALILQDQLSCIELAKLMAKLMDNESLRIQLSNHAQKTSHSITWEKTVNSTLNAYSIALQQNSNNLKPSHRDKGVLSD